MSDSINHPKHYTKHKVECIKYTRKMGDPNVANAVKYCWRLGNKDDAIEDANKALWYINDRLKHYPTVTFTSTIVDVVVGCLTRRSSRFTTPEVNDLLYIQESSFLKVALVNLCLSETYNLNDKVDALLIARDALLDYLDNRA